MSSWHPVKDRHRLAVAIYHFNPNQEVAENKEETQESAQDEEGDEDEAALENGSSSKHPVQFWRLQLTVGDLVVVREEYDQWYFGHLQNNPGLLGIFPKSFVSTEVGDESKSPPIVKEISAMLREWNFYFRDRFLHGDTEVLSLLKAIMKEVIIMRTSLIGMKMTREEVKETQRKVTTKMDFLNHRLGLDLVVRDPEGNILSPEQTSSVALYRQHVQGSEEIKNMMITKPREESETSNTFEIMMNVKNFVSSKVLEDVDLILSIYEVSLLFLSAFTYFLFLQFVVLSISCILVFQIIFAFFDCPKYFLQKNSLVRNCVRYKFSFC